MTMTTLIGQPVHRAEDLRFLKGAGTYVDDLKREGMCMRFFAAAQPTAGYAVLIRPPRLPCGGVHVITAADIGEKILFVRSCDCRCSRTNSPPVMAKGSVTSANPSRWWY
jgi:CO/xanthine dehydrogenase Mo-binding subunit